MTINLAKRVAEIKPSATLAISAKANQLKAEGKDIINLGVGEPDFNTPDFIKEAAIQAIHDNFTRYTAADGIVELKSAIQAKFLRDNQLSYALDEIMVTNGGKQALYNACQVLLNPGDEAIIPAPYWVSYPAMVMLAEGSPVIAKSTYEQRFKLTAEQLNGAITEATRLFFINSPSNPSGMVYNEQELAELAEVLKEHPKITIITDDIYEHIQWTGKPFVNILNVCPELSDRTLVVNGASKEYAMTGWRIGYIAGPKHIVGAMKKIQSQSTSNPCSIAQKAALAALEGDNSYQKDWVATYHARHNMVVDALNAIPGFQTVPCDGAFYQFPDVKEAIKACGLKDDVEFAEFLLDKAGVATVPGTAFGSPGHIRISYALDEASLQKALENIATALATTLA